MFGHTDEYDIARSFPTDHLGFDDGEHGAPGRIEAIVHGILERILASPSETSWRSLWTRASSRAGTSGCSPSTGRSRAGTGALVFSKEAPDVLGGMTRCLWSLGGLPELIVWDREGCLHARAGRPTVVYAGFCGQLPVGWLFCEPADPQAKRCVERLQGHIGTNFGPGRRFANHLDFQLHLDDC